MSEVLSSSVVLFLAGFVYGCTGFGFGLVAVPALALILAPARAVPLTTLVGLPLNLYLVFGARRSVKPRLLALLMGGAIVAAPVGAWTLRVVPAAPMKAVLGVLFSALGVVLLTGFVRPLRKERLGTFAAGSAAGLLGAAAGVPGPPILLFLANQGEAKDVVRASLVAFFLLSNPLYLVSYGALGLLDAELGVLALKTLPAALLGSGAGALLAGKISEGLFRRIVLGLVVVSGALLLFTNLD